MKKRISIPFLAAVVVVLIAVIVIVKPFPQKASAVFPEKLLKLSCTVARESVDGAEKRALYAEGWLCDDRGYLLRTGPLEQLVLS